MRGSTGVVTDKAWWELIAHYYIFWVWGIIFLFGCVLFVGNRMLITRNSYVLLLKQQNKFLYFNWGWGWGVYLMEGRTSTASQACGKIATTKKIPTVKENSPIGATWARKHVPRTNQINHTEPHVWLKPERPVTKSSTPFQVSRLERSKNVQSYRLGE